MACEEILNLLMGVNVLRKRASVMVLLLTCVISLVGCNNTEDEIVDDPNRAVYIVDGEDSWEIRYDEDTDSLIGYHNGRETGTFDREYNGMPIFDIPETDETNDLLGMPLITDGVYRTKPVEGQMYINYLLENGYTQDRVAQAHKFIEYFLSNEEAELTQRVIITENYTVVGTLDFGDIPDVNMNDYLFD